MKTQTTQQSVSPVKEPKTEIWIIRHRETKEVLLRGSKEEMELAYKSKSHAVLELVPTPPAKHTGGEHTPTPWTYIESKTLIHIETANLGDGSPCGMPVCSIPVSRKQDAAHIVHCVNMHEELVEYLQYEEDALNLTQMDFFEKHGVAIRKLVTIRRDILARAKSV